MPPLTYRLWYYVAPSLPGSWVHLVLWRLVTVGGLLCCSSRRPMMAFSSLPTLSLSTVDGLIVPLLVQMLEWRMLMTWILPAWEGDVSAWWWSYSGCGAVQLSVILQLTWWSSSLCLFWQEPKTSQWWWPPERLWRPLDKSRIQHARNTVTCTVRGERS